MSSQFGYCGEMMFSMIRMAGDAIAARSSAERRLCIVNYHQIFSDEHALLEEEPSVAKFRWQMELLAKAFNVIPLSQAVDALAAGTLPPRAVCITFDDGYRSFQQHAFPILREYGLPATVFVASGYINETNMWNDRILKALECAPGPSIDLRSLGLETYQIDDSKNRRQAISRITERVKYQSFDTRQAMAIKLEEITGKKLNEPLMLTAPMLRELSESGIEIGGHTVSHPILMQTDDQVALHEMETGKRDLEAIIQKPVQFFAYPNGKQGIDFDERHVQLARQIGFSAAFTTAHGPATSKHDRFLLPRSRPWDKTPAGFGLRLLFWLAGKY